METFTIYYNDHVGRKNQAESSGVNQLEAEKKFKTLYPDCIITDTQKTTS